METYIPAWIGLGKDGVIACLLVYLAVNVNYLKNHANDLKCDIKDIWSSINNLRDKL